jgi:hypothetical protein
MKMGLLRISRLFTIHGIYTHIIWEEKNNNKFLGKEEENEKYKSFDSFRVCNGSSEFRFG